MHVAANRQRITHLVWIFPLAWGVMIYFMLTMEVEVEPRTWMFPHFDKIVHMTLFGTLAWLLLLPLRFSLRQTVLTAAWLSFFLAAAYGSWTEYLQSALPHRDGNWADVVANALGAATVLFTTRKTAKTTLTTPP